MRPHRIVAALALAGALSGFALAAEADVLIHVDKTRQRMSVVVDGALRWTWPVSTGIAAYDTPNGRYTAFRMEKDHYSTEWDDAPMPHSIFFTQVGHAIHGTTYPKRLGRPASHGCVRLELDKAAQLFALVEQQGMGNTRVVIAGEIPTSAPLVAGRTPPPRAGRAYAEPERAGIQLPALWQQPQEHVRRGLAPPPVIEQRHLRFHERRRLHDSRRNEGRAGAVYDPRVEIVEQSYVNGTWVRRRYYRQARPSDFNRR